MTITMTDIEANELYNALCRAETESHSAVTYAESMLRCAREAYANAQAARTAYIGAVNAKNHRDAS